METPQEEAVYPLSPNLAESIHILRSRRKKIKIRLWGKNRLILWGLMLALLVISVLTFATMDYGDVVVIEAIKQFFADIRRIFLQPHLSGRFSLVSLVEALGITIGLSIVTTLLGAIVAFFLSLLAACNLSSKRLSTVIRVVMSFIRAVPTILWVLIFSIIIGLGSNAAVIGMLFHSVAYLTKVYSESIEEMDEGVIEALKASGATWWQIVFQVVLPSCITALLSWTFIRFEINFTNAIAVGAAAGAGGLGFQLAMASGFYFDLHEIGVMVYMVLIVAAALELISMKLRSNYIVKN
ncbi:PhnE/PtxC family ABC transporter permease [Enterococcus sp.]|uniref:PhnE/PtxC family ABC transporter permease n=1 Tax=Enterococcus sp. TaxID=35783 RepID=UPI00290E1466|nr:ABC transporter permease subunit [Enterococcus sp.]MDU5334509.1 ABC transporter permease subunit [Enterococcus sp.]